MYRSFHFIGFHITFISPDPPNTQPSWYSLLVFIHFIIKPIAFHSQHIQSFRILLPIVSHLETVEPEFSVSQHRYRIALSYPFIGAPVELLSQRCQRTHPAPDRFPPGTSFQDSPLAPEWGVPLRASAQSLGLSTGTAWA